MGVAFRKVWRDLWKNKGRTVLVVLSIGVGVLAVGMIIASNALISRQMTLSQKASRPSNVIMYLAGLIDDDTVASIARLPEVVDAQGVVSYDIRWKPTLDAEWKQSTLIALDDYTHQQFDLVELRSGAWPGSDSVAIEFNHVTPYNAPAVGGTIYFEVNNRPKAVTLGGTVRDPQQFPPPFAQQPAFYATRDMMVLLGGYRDYSQLKFTIPEYTKQNADTAADVVEKRLNKLGVSVGFIQTQDPNRHFLQDMMDGVGMVLGVMAFLSLLLSAILVINTMNALVAQQIPQIGIMKTVGGLSRQIAQLYLAGVSVYCFLSLALAVPVGALGGDALARWMLALLNVPTSPFEVLQIALIAQIATGLLIPLLAALWPVMQGVAVSVRQAISAYGVGTGRYGGGRIDRILSQVQGLPRMTALALRNTFRRIGRVALTEITLIVAGAIFMMVVSTHYSFNKTIEQLFAGFGFDVLVGFEQPQRVDEVAPLMESRPGVEHAEMWMWRTAKAKVPGAEGPGADHEIFLRAIPRDSELFSPELTGGRNLVANDGHALLLNQKLARKMGLGVGDRIEIDLGDAGETDWTIVGLIFDLGGRDQNTAYLHRDTLAEELNQVGRASVAEIKVSVPTLAAQEAVEKDMRDYFKSRGVTVSWTDTAIRNTEQANAQFSILTTLLLVMTFLIAIVGSMGLSGTLSINVLERRREIGVMRAVGASSFDVAMIFMGEGLLLGVLSWVQALPISLLASRYFVETLGEVIDFPAVYHYSTTGVWVWLAIVVALSLLASWLPARRATQISVRESLAYE
ncbi:MAG: ABC transporter permease [Chloroflexi bacterium]|nr:ABC transporter permease [Chloroflexota bacterium]